MEFTLKVNGKSPTVKADGTDFLLYILRDKLDLTGTKYGCGVGVCGACTCHSSTPIVAAGFGNDENGKPTANNQSPYDTKSRFMGTQPTMQRNKFRPCVTRISDVGSREITTIEGLAGLPGGPALQAAWKANDVAQCGFCQAGQLMTAYEYLVRVKGVTTPDGITAAMQANLCRCGTYPRIRAAIETAAKAFVSLPATT